MKSLFNKIFKKKKPLSKEALLNQYYDAKVAHDYARLNELAKQITATK